jgi:hypothetical protein
MASPNGYIGPLTACWRRWCLTTNVIGANAFPPSWLLIVLPSTLLTNHSPNFLTFGRELNAPTDLMLGRPDDQQYSSIDEYVELKFRHMEEAYQLARETLTTISARNKIRYDVRSRPRNIDNGGWIWYYSPRRYAGLSAKLQRNYSGPFLVVRKLSPVLWVIQKSPRANEILAHVGKLKRCYGEHPASWLQLGEETGPMTVSETPPLIQHDPMVISSENATTPSPTPMPLRVEAPPFVPRKAATTQGVIHTLLNPKLRQLVIQCPKSHVLNVQ